MRNLESKLQSECVKWFRYQYPQYKGLLFAIPNGGHRNIITARILKAEGVLAGVADLFFAKPSDGVHGCFIEMKFGKGKQTESQKAFSAEVIKHGYLYWICYSFDDFQKLITQYLT